MQGLFGLRHPAYALEACGMMAATAVKEQAMATPPKRYYTPEEYLALERQAARKSEYLDGQIYAMAGASAAHTLITANMVRESG